MSTHGSITLPARRDPAVVRIARRWRELTTGRTASGRLGRGERTMIACSGGADSSALVLAMAAVTRDLLVAHVVHDLRSESESLADRDVAKELAADLDLPFVESRVSTRSLTIDDAPCEIGPPAGGRNPEGLARHLRYLALERLATAHAIRYVATAHHAGDQLESMLMALMRGSGPRGLRGVASTRRITPAGPIMLIRPMLGVDRAECERICCEAGWKWREDATNTDTAYLRAYVRHEVIPRLRAARPGVERRAAAAAELLHDAAGLVAERADSLLTRAEATPGSLAWPRDLLRGERRVVIGETLLRAVHHLRAGAGMDRFGRDSLDAVIDAVRSRSTHPRHFTLSGVTAQVTSGSVVITRTDV